MVDLPPFREIDDEPQDASYAAPAWLKIIVWLIIIGLVLVIVGLHLGGVVGPGSN